MKSGNLNFVEPSGPLQACNGTALPLTTINNKSMPIPIQCNLFNKNKNKKIVKQKDYKVLTQIS